MASEEVAGAFKNGGRGGAFERRVRAFTGPSFGRPPPSPPTLPRKANRAEGPKLLLPVIGPSGRPATRLTLLSVRYQTDLECGPLNFVYINSAKMWKKGSQPEMTTP
jgi:hypothetical protein